MDGSKLNLGSLRDKISSKLKESNSGSSKASKVKGKATDKQSKEVKEGDKAEAKGNKKGGKKEGKGEPKNPGSKKRKEEKKNDDRVSDAAEVATEEDIMRQEALELGATEEDLALLTGVQHDDESEQEFEDSGEKLEKSFGNELSTFMKQIGLGDGTAPVEVEDEDEDEDADEEFESASDGISEHASDEDDSEVVSDVESADEDDVKNSVEQDDSEDEQEEEEEGTSEQDVQVEFRNLKEPKKEKKPNPDKITDVASVDSSKLLIPGRTDWYNIKTETPTNPEKLDRFARERLYERAQRVIDEENKKYLQEFTANNSQRKFLSQILTDGTLNDKISALTLLIQEAPVHNLKAFDTLLNYCEKKSRTASLQSINAMKDLLLNGILPDRKLVAFEKQPLSKDLSDTTAALYFFEDHLKKAYFKLITVLEVLSHDPIVHVRLSVVNHVFDLLKTKPEQEVNLLRLGTSKLGDPDKKVTSRASYQILQLQQAHPAMRKIIVDGIIDGMMKTNTDHHMKYYCTVTLNQTILTRKDEDVANTLVKVYFATFERVLVESDIYNKETSKDDKLIGKSEKGRKNNRKNFKKGKKGGKSVKAETKTESEVMEEKNSRLFSALFTGLNRAFAFSNLPSEIFQKHLNTLFKITHSSNFNTSVQALILINHIVTSQNLDSDRFYKTMYESLLDHRLQTSSKQGFYLNLLFKTLKNDDNINRVLAFVKRILQVTSHWLNVGAITGMLYLLMELSKKFTEVEQYLNISPAELQYDVEKDEPSKVKAEEGSDKDEQDAEEAGNVQRDEYDSRKRDPKFANADRSPLWEVIKFLNHYHPSVAVYATSLMEGSTQPKPDLGLFTLSHFLDRFVYKNAKQAPATKGSSIMQPLGGAHTGSLLVKATNVNGEVPVNTENWLLKKAEDIRPEEKFFHQYFTTRSNKMKLDKPSRARADDEGDDEEHEEDQVWQALVKSRPEVEDDGEMDDFSDFDEGDFSDMSDNESSDDVVAEDVEDQEINSAIEQNDNSGSLNDVNDNGSSDNVAAASLTETVAEDSLSESFASDGFASEENEIFGINEDDELSDSDSEIKMLDFDGPSDSDSDHSSEHDRPVNKRSHPQANPTKDAKKSKKAKLSALPVFASAEDYSQYLDSDDEDYN